MGCPWGYARGLQGLGNPGAALGLERGFKVELTPQCQCRAWIYKHADALQGLTLSRSTPRGVTGCSPWGRSPGRAGGEGAGVCPLLPTHEPCAAASSLAQPPPCAAMNCGVVAPGSAAGLCSRRTWQRPSRSGGPGRGAPSEEAVAASTGPGHQEPGCFVGALAAGLSGLFQGTNSLSRDAPAEQLLRAAPKHPLLCLCPKLPQATQGRGLEGPGRSRGPPPGSVWGAVPIARARLPVLMVPVLQLHEVYPWQLVPAVLASVVRRATTEFPWCCHPTPSSRCLCRPLSHLKCHRRGWSWGCRAGLCFRGSLCLGSGQAATSITPEAAGPWGLSPGWQGGGRC